ncbi:MAG: peptidoglycan DD-metalloendopeptidase family protein [candidate division Zixibacteria bacterium]|nr:peptidoglycan DD-metalloendopeptidase family protein [candidate division Zixibacteria bacterium]
MKLFFKLSFFLFLPFLSSGILLYSFNKTEVRAQNLDNKIAEQKDELENIRKELEEKREKIKKLSKKESSVFIEIKDLEEELELMDKLLLRLNLKSKQAGKDITATEVLLEKSQLRLQAKRDELGCRLRDIYKYMRFREYEILTGASSPLDLMRRLKYIKLITRQDQSLIQEVSKGIENIEKNKISLESKRKELAFLIKEKNKEENKRSTEKNKREKLLKKIRSEKEIHLQSVKELEKSAKEIEKLLTSLEKERFKKEVEITTGLFRVLKGRLPWPVTGKVALGFGEQKESRFNTKLFNPGIDISPSSDLEVKAVADGRVVYSSWLRGYGNFIILQHDDGYYTVYANLKEILVGVGEDVGRAQTIARLNGSENNFHFEIRKGKEQLDPLEWLK